MVKNIKLNSYILYNRGNKMSHYTDIFSIEELNLGSSFRISFSKKLETCTVEFVNSTYPDVVIPLPESMQVISGSSIVFPEVSGVY